MRTQLFAAIASFGLIACVGGIDGTTPNPTPDGPAPTTNEGRVMFDRDVYPIIAASARCITCHSAAGPSGNVTGFVSPDATSGYATATGYVALVGNFTTGASPILTKIAGGHQNMAYTPDEVGKITAWLGKEVELRSGQPPPPAGNESPSSATTRLLLQWSGCMTQTNFDTANMPNGWAHMQAENNEECQNCHVAGAEGFMASQNSIPFFTTVSSNKYYMLQYFTVDLTMGVPAAKVIINTMSFQGVSQGQDPHREHPRFNPLGSQGMNALQAFYDSTMLNLTAGTCDPPRLTN